MNADKISYERVEWNGGMERWNGIVEWNSGMVEYWKGGKTTPTNYAVSLPFPISFICHGPETSIP